MLNAVPVPLGRIVNAAGDTSRTQQLVSGSYVACQRVRCGSMRTLQLRVHAEKGAHMASLKIKLTATQPLGNADLQTTSNGDAAGSVIEHTMVFVGNNCDDLIMSVTHLGEDDVFVQVKATNDGSAMTAADFVVIDAVGYDG